MLVVNDVSKGPEGERALGPGLSLSLEIALVKLVTYHAGIQQALWLVLPGQHGLVCQHTNLPLAWGQLFERIGSFPGSTVRLVNPPSSDTHLRRERGQRGVARGISVTASPVLDGSREHHSPRCLEHRSAIPGE